jgi:hypothetical protein
MNSQIFNHTGIRKQMSKKSMFFPRYKLVAESGDSLAKNKAVFNWKGISFCTKFPIFCVTESQKAALRWLSSHKSAPVMVVSHGKPVEPDKEFLVDPDELHRHFYPYAMTDVTALSIDGGKHLLRVYFCNIELHESARYGVRETHAKDKGVYIVNMS